MMRGSRSAVENTTALSQMDSAPMADPMAPPSHTESSAQGTPTGRCLVWRSRSSSWPTVRWMHVMFAEEEPQWPWREGNLAGNLGS